MGWTKEDLAKEALTELGLPSYTFDLQPEDVIAIVVRLDAMMSEWDVKGIRFGYPLAYGPRDSWGEQDSGLPDTAIFAVIPNLAIRVAAMFGRQPMATLQANAKASLESMFTMFAKPYDYRWPSTMPYGAGNKPYRTNNRQFAGSSMPNTIQQPVTEIAFTPESNK